MELLRSLKWPILAAIVSTELLINFCTNSTIRLSISWVSDIIQPTTFWNDAVVVLRLEHHRPHIQAEQACQLLTLTDNFDVNLCPLARHCVQGCWAADVCAGLVRSLAYLHVSGHKVSCVFLYMHSCTNCSDSVFWCCHDHPGPQSPSCDQCLFPPERQWLPSLWAPCLQGNMYERRDSDLQGQHAIKLRRGTGFFPGYYTGGDRGQ